MNDRRFVLKGACVGVLVGLLVLGSGLAASAQEEGTPTGAAADDTGSVAASGDTTVSVIGGVPSIVTVEDEATEDEAAEDGGTDTQPEISADSSLSVADASGGDDNLATGSGS